MTKAPVPSENKVKRQNKNATTNFDYIMILDQLRPVNWLNRFTRYQLSHLTQQQCYQTDTVRCCLHYKLTCTKMNTFLNLVNVKLKYRCLRNTNAPPFPNISRIGLTFDLSSNDLNIDRGHLFTKDFLPTKFWSFLGKAFLTYRLHKVSETDMTFDLHLWHTDLEINRDHILMKDYLPTKFEASGVKRSWLIGCTRCWWPTWPFTFDLLTGSSTHQGLSTY